jgi:hypothetical protein
MSPKTLIVLAALGGAGWALTRTVPPPPSNASRADSAAVSQASIGARFHYGVGMLGVKVVGTTVRNSVFDTEQAIKDLQPAIKKTRGGNGMRAKKFSENVKRLDQLALDHLEHGRPIEAVQSAMEATSILGAVKSQIRTGI